MRNFGYPDKVYSDDFQAPEAAAERVRVIGLGSAGLNIVTDMYNFYHDKICDFLKELKSKNLLDIKFMIADTDCAQLRKKEIPEEYKLLLNLTSGKGTGGVWEKGKRAVQNAMKKFEAFVEDSTFIIIIAGLGGGTGSGGLLALAKYLKEKYPSTPIVNLAVLPRNMEGKKRRLGYDLLRKYLNEELSILLVDNDKLWERAVRILGQDAGVDEIWRKINELIVESLFGMILSKCSVGIIHIDAEDLRKAFFEPGIATILYHELDNGYEDSYLRAEGVMKEFLNSSLINLGNATPKYLYIFFIAHRKISATFFDNFCNTLSQFFKEGVIMKQDYINMPEEVDSKRAIIGIATGLPLPPLGSSIKEEGIKGKKAQTEGSKISII